MNCKPGDLAVIVGTLPDDGTLVGKIMRAITVALQGRVVRVVRLEFQPHRFSPTGNVWTFEDEILLDGNGLPLPPGIGFAEVSDVLITGMDDCFLRPLPKLDEDDEILAERPRDEVLA
jgi:hypothetical protein